MQLSQKAIRAASHLNGYIVGDTLQLLRMGIMKFTGARGKSGSNDASAELVGRVRKLMNDNNVAWQMGELGKVDQGGGGTIASIMGNRNIDTIDAGVPVLNMHAPMEVISKADAYMTYRGFKAFYNACI